MNTSAKLAAASRGVDMNVAMQRIEVVEVEIEAEAERLGPGRKLKPCLAPRRV